MNDANGSSTSAARADVSSEVHLCDNYLHLLYAAADLAARSEDDGERLVLFIDDQLPLHDDLRAELTQLTGAEIVVVSDRSAIEDFARLPRRAPAMLRRNLSWSARGTPIGPRSWVPPFLSERRFGIGYVYHPGFFLSKVVAGRCDVVVMRESGYANYVPHRVPWSRRLPRLLAGRPPGVQVWGEEPWVDAIEVVRPEQLPERVRHKASPLTLDMLMGALPTERARAVAQAFWGTAPPVASPERPTALVITQPIDQLGICSTPEKLDVYRDVVRRLRHLDLDVIVKPHPRERVTLDGEREVPASFPIEAWAWLGQAPFEVAVSLNSTALAASGRSFARDGVQLIPPERFYPADWAEWPRLIEDAWHRWEHQMNGNTNTTRANERPA